VNVTDPSEVKPGQRKHHLGFWQLESELINCHDPWGGAKTTTKERPWVFVELVQVDHAKGGGMQVWDNRISTSQEYIINMKA
jgi:hypothetical protein